MIWDDWLVNEISEVNHVPESNVPLDTVTSWITIMVPQYCYMSTDTRLVIPHSYMYTNTRVLYYTSYCHCYPYRPLGH